jgi:hypothetical protein
MIEHVLNPKKSERQSDQENVVGRVTALNHVKTSPQIYPPGKKELPEQGATELPHITQGAVPFLGHGVPVDMHPLQTLVSFLVTFAFWAQDGHFVSVVKQGASLLPHTGIKRNGKVLDNNEDFLFHNRDLVTYSVL